MTDKDRDNIQNILDAYAPHKTDGLAFTEADLQECYDWAMSANVSDIDYVRLYGSKLAQAMFLEIFEAVSPIAQTGLYKALKED